MSNFDAQGRFTAPVNVVDPSTMINNFTADGRFVQPVMLIDPTTGLPYSPSSGGGGGGAPAAYLGQVATRSYAPTANYTGATMIQSRTGHWARDAITSLQLNFSNWWIKSGSGDTDNTAAATIKATIEYPAGTYTRVTFGASQTGSWTTGDILSDAVAVVIPKGAKFWVRSLYTCSAGIIYTGFLTNEPNGDGAETGTALTDKTGGGALAAGTNFYFPTAIVAQTANPSVFLPGDSIMKGQLDTFDDLVSDQGVVARSVGPYMGYCNAGCTGDTTAALVASHGRRVALSQYFSHIVCNYGGPNDQTVATATVQAGLVAAGAYWPAGKKRFLCTYVPHSTSTDSFATVANQTSSGLAYFQAMNQFVRTTPQNWDGFVDPAKVVESAPYSNLWAPPSPNGGGALTSDGTHPITLGNQLIARSDTIRHEMFSRALP